VDETLTQNFQRSSPVVEGQRGNHLAWRGASDMAQNETEDLKSAALSELADWISELGDIAAEVRTEAEERSYTARAEHVQAIHDQLADAYVLTRDELEDLLRFVADAANNDPSELGSDYGRWIDRLVTRWRAQMTAMGVTVLGAPSGGWGGLVAVALALLVRAWRR
jgi:hypothetical protein